MSDDRMHIALATDVQYLPWCAVAVLSCVETQARPVHVHLLHEGDLHDAVQERFAGMVRDAGGDITFHDVAGERLRQLPSKGPELGGRTSWMRVFLPELLPAVDRIVYLDADTLTVDALEPLWTMPLGDAPIAAVSNVVEPSKRAH